MYLPLFFDTDNLTCLVVGGGRVALRKIEVLLGSCCRQILLISPEVIPELRSFIIEKKIAHFQREFQTGDCMSKHLVISATGDKSVNMKVSEEARGLGIPVNVVDAPELSTVIFPAIERNEPFVLAVSTGGCAPFMAGEIRDRLKKSTEGFSEWIVIASRFRDIVCSSTIDIGKKRELYKRFIDAGMLNDGDNPPDSNDLDTWLNWLNKISKARDNN
jgi:uroporphyrin-III C-methyltransferase/precorrin-2 dehydrogenase/sirohydrochlorin ferrochelatase